MYVVVVEVRAVLRKEAIRDSLTHSFTGSIRKVAHLLAILEIRRWAQFVRSISVDRNHAYNDKKITYYGIATTSYFWHLIELKENGVKSSERIVGCFDDKNEDMKEKERISGVIAHIVNVLNKCKTNYDDAADAAEK